MGQGGFFVVSVVTANFGELEYKTREVRIRSIRKEVVGMKKF